MGEPGRRAPCFVYWILVVGNLHAPVTDSLDSPAKAVSSSAAIGNINNTIPESSILLLVFLALRVHSLLTVLLCPGLQTLNPEYRVLFFKNPTGGLASARCASLALSSDKSSPHRCWYLAHATAQPQGALPTPLPHWEIVIEFARDPTRKRSVIIYKRLQRLANKDLSTLQHKRFGFNNVKR